MRRRGSALSYTQHGNTPHRQVLSVGGGPVSLVAACDLARRGVAVRIVDAAAAPATGSRVKGPHPRSLEVFDDLQAAAHRGAAGGVAGAARRYEAERSWAGVISTPMPRNRPRPRRAPAS
ncbi:FAD-dependent monooxygenase [Actinacidiphila sp. bgisy167]|uniref:FAD-dependent monooxygenase n=1 Tax=Actinacidiphila sp. bgisy167 TaxID=3413797 RepID=UPI003D72372D